MPDTPNPKNSGSPLGSLVQAESMLQLALVLPIGCGLGWFIGAALDKHFGVSWISIVGLLMGAAAGFIQIFRMASSYLKKGQ